MTVLVVTALIALAIGLGGALFIRSRKPAPRPSPEPVAVAPQVALPEVRSTDAASDYDDEEDGGRTVLVSNLKLRLDELCESCGAPLNRAPVCAKCGARQG